MRDSVGGTLPRSLNVVDTFQTRFAEFARRGNHNAPVDFENRLPGLTVNKRRVEGGGPTITLTFELPKPKLGVLATLPGKGVVREVANVGGYMWIVCGGDGLDEKMGDTEGSDDAAYEGTTGSKGKSR
jgi:hypothetical protein